MRVEIRNQRVHDVEDLVARQIQNLIKVFIDATDVKRSEGVESVDKFDRNIVKERRDKCRWLALDIYLAASRLGKYPPLATSTSVNSC